MLSPAVTRRLIAEYVAPRDHPQRVESRRKLALLSDRERDVLNLMAEGRSNQAIAKDLRINDKTVESHISAIFTKLTLLPEPDDHRRVLAVLTWLQQPG